MKTPKSESAVRPQANRIGRVARWAGVLCAVSALVSCATPGGDTSGEKKTHARNMAKQALRELYAAKPAARQQVASSAGYAVFNRNDTRFMVVGGANGYGLAVDNNSGKETFLRMAGLSAGIGAEVKNSRAVLIFRSRSAYQQFVTSGRMANVSAGAGAALDSSGAGVGVKVNPDADPLIYQFTNSGVSLSASLGAERIWPDRELNQ